MLAVTLAHIGGALMVAMRRDSESREKCVLLLAGTTIEDLGSPRRLVEYLEEMMGQGESGKRYCYLCKRREGDRTIAIDMDEELEMEDSIIAPHLQLFGYEVKVGATAMLYLLCQECTVLVKGISKRFPEET